VRLTLLGTGSADGWPNPFCTCLSCATTSTIRTPTAVLVDSAVLLDCGPEAPRQALRAGARLDTLRAVWIGHDHPDHSAPLAMLSREWARALDSTERPRLQLIASATTLASWRQWIGPTSDINLVEAVPGEELQVAGYRLLPLGASHGTRENPGLLLHLTSPSGSSLLYGTDTGPLPEATIAALRGRRADLVLLEETFGTRADLAGAGDHLDLVGFECELARLRAVGTVDERTRVVAVHLSHHNPPGVDLDRRLAAVGAQAGRDGAEMTVGGDPPPHRTLIVGGARSGKSVTAERLLRHEAAVDYVATGYPAGDGDTEWAARVARHRARRRPGWRTIETIDLLTVLSAPGPAVLIDCLTLWLTRTLDAVGAWAADGETDADTAALQAVDAAVEDLVAAWRSTPRRVVAVSNEVGSGVVPATASGRLFRDLQGRLNAELGVTADTALLVVAGRAIPLDATADPPGGRS